MRIARRFLKITLWSLGIIIALLIIGILLVTTVFKKDVKEAIEAQIEQQVNADIYASEDDFSLSIFSNFPDITAQLKNFGVVGKDDFEGDTLVKMDEFAITIDLWSLFGDTYKVEGILLDKPVILAKVDKAGKANWDIYIPSEEQVAPEPEEEVKPMVLKVKEWEIRDGVVIYDDRAGDMYAEIRGLNHTGSALIAEKYDLVTSTSIAEFTYEMEGLAYLAEKPLESELTLHIDMTDTTRMLLSFDETSNFVKLADFEIDFAGWFAMTDEAMEMDITYAAKENTFASLFSLVPGVFLEDMAGMKLDGTITFDGYVKGNYTEETLPGFGLKLLVDKGLFQYPDLPTAVTGIGVDLSVDCKDGVIDETIIDLKKFVANLGGNLISARLRMAGLTVIALDAAANAKVDLATLTKMVPMEDTDLKGLIDLKVAANGVYNEASGELPAVSGGLKITDLIYKSADLPQGLTIPAAAMDLTPEAFTISQFDGTVGKSDFALTGKISNYLGYAFGEADPVLRGQMNLNSNVMDINEFMGDETEEVAATPEEEVALEVVGVPENIDFTFASKIADVKYSTWDMKNLVGTILVRDQRVSLLQGTGFDLFGGRVTASGFYDTKNIEKPEYDFVFGIASMKIQQAYEAFAPVRKYLPAAEKMAGSFSTDFKIGGLLGQDMMPIYETLTGGGIVKLQNASVSNLKALDAIQQATKLDNLNNVTLGNTAIKTQIVNGKLFVEQFPVKLGNVNSTVEGSTGITGALDYLVGMDVPAGQIGTQLNSQLSNLGVSNAGGSTVHLDLKMGGTIEDPKPTLLSNNAKQEAKDALEEKAKEEVEKAKEQVKEKVEEKKEEVKEEATEKVEEKKEEAKEKGKEKAKEKIKGFGF